MFPAYSCMKTAREPLKKHLTQAFQLRISTLHALHALFPLLDDPAKALLYPRTPLHPSYCGFGGLTLYGNPQKTFEKSEKHINMSLKSPQNRSERLLPVVMQLTEELRRLVKLHLLGLRQLAAISSSPTCVSVIRSSNSFLRFAFSTSKSTKIDGQTRENA